MPDREQPGTAPVSLLRLLLRRLRREVPSQAGPSAFIHGDATGSVIENVETDADVFIGGDRTGSVVRNVVHRARRHRG